MNRLFQVKPKTWAIWLWLAQLLLVLVIALPLLLLKHAGTVEEIKLKASPVDPYDAFYGYYATLNYEISSLPSKLITEAPQSMLQAGDTAYVALAKAANGIYDAVSISSREHEPRSGQIVLKARVDFIDESSGLINLMYGFERYYADQQQVTDLEDRIRKVWEQNQMTGTQQSMVVVTVQKSKWSNLFPWANYHVSKVDLM